MAYLICYRSGQAEISDRIPAGAISLAKGGRRRLSSILTALARHSYDGRTLLIPGLPEARSEEAALAAAETFSERVKLRLAMRPGREPARIRMAVGAQS